MTRFPVYSRGWRPRSDVGFTLIELMLVVAIVALLAAIATPKFSNLIDKSREAAMKGNLGVLRSALNIYYADNEGLYPKYNNMTPLVTRGIYHLHGKYVNFDEIFFRPPRYAGDYTHYTAMQLYGAPVMAMLYNSNATVPPDNLPVHTASPFPSYWNLPAGSGLGPSRVSLKTNAINPSPPFGDLLDSKGVAWSLW